MVEKKPFVVYDKDGDLIQVFLRTDAAYVAEVMGAGISIYREKGTERIIGFEVGEVGDLLAKAGIQAVDVTENEAGELVNFRSSWPEDEDEDD